MNQRDESSFEPYEEFSEYIAYFDTPCPGVWPAAGQSWTATGADSGSRREPVEDGRTGWGSRGPAAFFGSVQIS